MAQTPKEKKKQKKKEKKIEKETKKEEKKLKKELDDAKQPEMSEKKSVKEKVKEKVVEVKEKTVAKIDEAIGKQMDNFMTQTKILYSAMNNAGFELVDVSLEIAIEPAISCTI
eukprot:318195_1